MQRKKQEFTRQRIIFPLIKSPTQLFYGKNNFKKEKQAALKEADRIVNEGKIKADGLVKDKELQAKERFLQLKAEHEKEVNERNRTLQQRENQIDWTYQFSTYLSW